MVLLAPLTAAGCAEPVPVPLPCTETIEVDDTPGWVRGSATYEAPEFPWYSQQKAETLREAVLDALPSRAEVDQLDFGGLPTGTGNSSIDGSATAWSNVETPRGVGSLIMSVQHSTEPIPPCTKGYTLRREQWPDGTIVEHHRDEYGTVIDHGVTVYKPDGSRVTARSTNQHTDQDTMTDTFADQPALSLDELTRIATAAGVDAQPVDG